MNLQLRENLYLTLNSPADFWAYLFLHYTAVERKFFLRKTVLLGMSDLEFSEEDYIRDKQLLFESLKERYS